MFGIRRHKTGKHAGKLYTSKRGPRKVRVTTKRPRQTQEEKRAKARAYYHAHKAEINAKRRAKPRKVRGRYKGVAGGASAVYTRGKHKGQLKFPDIAARYF